MGTPAFPTAAIVARKTQSNHLDRRIGHPIAHRNKKNSDKNESSAAIHINGGQSGKLKLATRLETPTLSSAHFMAIGKAALDDFVKKATESAGSMPLAMRKGEIFFNFRRMGRMIKPWIKSAAMTTDKIEPNFLFQDLHVNHAQTM